MLVKLSGDRYINSDAIVSIRPVVFPDDRSKDRWVLILSAGDYERLTQQQFNELMDCLPTPIESDRKRSTR